jgi:hypothetical protein
MTVSCIGSAAKDFVVSPNDIEQVGIVTFVCPSCGLPRLYNHGLVTRAARSNPRLQPTAAGGTLTPRSRLVLREGAEAAEPPSR